MQAAPVPPGRRVVPAPLLTLALTADSQHREPSAPLDAAMLGVATTRPLGGETK